MKAKKDRVLTVKFNADIAATMRWNFRPQQSEVKLFAGETALAFYTAKNPSTKPIDGISTYNVVISQGVSNIISEPRIIRRREKLAFAHN